MEVPMATPDPFRYEKPVNTISPLTVLETQKRLLPNHSCLPNNSYSLSTYLGVDLLGWLYRWLAMEDQEFTACLSDRFVLSYISYCLYTYHFENILPPTICYTMSITGRTLLLPRPLLFLQHVHASHWHWRQVHLRKQRPPQCCIAANGLKTSSLLPLQVGVVTQIFMIWYHQTHGSVSSLMFNQEHASPTSRLSVISKWRE
jgi:hypothetical protein